MIRICLMIKDSNLGIQGCINHSQPRFQMLRLRFKPLDYVFNVHNLVNNQQLTNDLTYKPAPIKRQLKKRADCEDDDKKNEAKNEFSFFTFAREIYSYVTCIHFTERKKGKFKGNEDLRLIKGSQPRCSRID